MCVYMCIGPAKSPPIIMTGERKQCFAAFVTCYLIQQLHVKVACQKTTVKNDHQLHFFFFSGLRKSVTIFEGMNGWKLENRFVICTLIFGCKKTDFLTVFWGAIDKLHSRKIYIKEKAPKKKWNRKIGYIILVEKNKPKIIIFPPFFSGPNGARNRQ